MLPEMNTSSMLAVITLIWLIKPFLSRQYDILDEDNVDSFFARYILTFGILSSLFTYTIIRGWYPYDLFRELLLKSWFAGMCVMAALSIAEPFQYLWVRFPESSYKILLWMCVILAIPFVGIFTIQSELMNGLYWFFGTIVAFCLVELILEIGELGSEGFSTEG